MFDFVRRLLGKPAEAPSASAPPAADPSTHAFARLNEMAPLKPAGGGERPGVADGAVPPERSFVCRDPVLNRQERIAGYEFALHRKMAQRLLNRSAVVRKVYDDALLRNLQALNLAQLLGHRQAFIHLSPDSLFNPLVEALPAANAVLMMTPTDEPADALAGPQQRLIALQAAGYRVGWSLRAPNADWLPLMASADFVQIEAPSFNGVELKSLARDLRRDRPEALGPIQLLARELPTYDDFNLCFQSGFDFFQGPFVSSRDNWHPPKSETNRLKVLELLNLVRSGAEAEAIAQSLKTEPVLTFKLLRYLNSPAMGLAREVTTIPQALLVLGRDSFYRWLSLLLFDIKNPGYRERYLTEQALARGRLMEMLAGQGHAPAAADHCFLTGLFSLLDVLMGQPLPEMLQQVTLPDAVRGALLGTPGPMHDLLQLAVATENGDSDSVAPLAARCDLSPALVSIAGLKASGWAQALSGAQDG